MLLAGALILCTQIAGAQEWKMLKDLRGSWKFELGDDPKRAEPGFRDADWAEIFVPSAWEDEGYPGYDGYAWYRTRFTAPADLSGKFIYLQLGNVDDVCAVYLNGIHVGGAGSFPPDFATAYDVQVSLPIGEDVLRSGRENTLAIRVFDEHLSGGILRGRIGLVERTDLLRPDVPLPAVWKFSTGDDPDWKTPGFNHSGWSEARMPASWEALGLSNYDGMGWYRVRFTVPEALRERQLILLLGKIDDLDETYLNGTLIGRTGRIRSDGTGQPTENEHMQLRAYTIPPGSLRAGENTLAVRVLDVMFTGGMYDGPIGIVTRERYLSWPGRPSPPKPQKRWWEVFGW